MISAETDKREIKHMTVQVNLSRYERDSAKHLAKSKGMTFQGWLGQLIKRELREAEKEVR